MTSKILPKVFGWMFIGLLVTFFTGYYVSLHPETMFKLFGSYAFLIVIIIEFAIVIFLSARITKMKPATAIVSFTIYSAVSGLTFSTIFVTYDLGSIMYVFFPVSFNPPKLKILIFSIKFAPSFFVIFLFCSFK